MLFLLMAGKASENISWCLGRQTFIAAVLWLFLAGCNPDASSDEFVELSPQEMGDMIDYFAGHPDDPDLPNSVLGAIDEALLSMNPREIIDFLIDTESFARDSASAPRHLFALGRVAYLHGYGKLATDYLTEAAKRGSAPAWAYLGYQDAEKGDFKAAQTHLLKAVDQNFNPLDVQQALDALEYAVFSPDKFNRPDLIQALYDSDMETLRQVPAIFSSDTFNLGDLIQVLRDFDMETLGQVLENGYYIGTVHNTLWANDILFIIDDPGIFLELDPDISYKGFLINEAKNSLIGRAIMRTGFGVLEDQAVQDARRLALLYTANPEAFRQVYHGMSNFFNGGSDDE